MSTIPVPKRLSPEFKPQCYEYDFEFSLSNEEKDDLLKDIEEKINSGIWVSNEKHHEIIMNEVMGNLYCEMGWQVHGIYMLEKENGPDVKERMQEFLVKRAYLSALLQNFVENLQEKGYDTDVRPFAATQERPKIELNTIYHATPNSTLTLETFESGRNENGQFPNRDGVGYYTTSKDRAEKVITGSINVLEKNLSAEEKDSMYLMEHTDGYTPYFYQDEIIEFIAREREKGKDVKYLYSYRKNNGKEEVSPQILDVSNFIAYVHEREDVVSSLLDKYNLRLPNKESLEQYCEAIGVDKEKYQNIINSFLYDSNNKDMSIKSSVKSFDQIFPDVTKQKKDDKILESAVAATERSYGK